MNRLFIRKMILAISVLAAFHSSHRLSAQEKSLPGSVVPLFDQSTKRDPEIVKDTPDALITYVADRVRDRHAREAKFRAYDHYLSWYWEHRTVGIEVVDRVAKGGKDVTFNFTSLWPLDTPDFRAFYRGKNTVAEYAYNVDSKKIDDTHYTATVKHNPNQKRPLKIGDIIEIEFSPFLIKPPRGRANYYGTAMVYVVGQAGMVPWEGVGPTLDSQPLPKLAWLGGRTTLPYQYSNEPRERFKQLATNIAPINAQPFMLGRRLHHTDFGDGKHSEPGNPIYEEQVGKLGPHFVARSCVACHVNNGRALPPKDGSLMLQSVVKVGADARGNDHPKLGSALQPQTVKGQPNASVRMAGYSEIEGKYADGVPYTLRKPIYEFKGVVPEFYSVRLTPQLVGLGLLEAIPESTILALAEQKHTDGVKGRARIVTDPVTKQSRLGRFGYRASQPRLSHQIAAALHGDMGVTTSIFSKEIELADGDLDNMVRYVATLGVSARRDLTDVEALRGEKLFANAGCVKCHVPTLQTSAYHPFAELRNQTIHPFTDLLLHNMGPGLADNMGEADVSGAEWRTPPLWSIGLTKDVSAGEAYLHDGRARSLEEAILWHGGEAESAKEVFRKMPARDRSALVRFLRSL